MKVGTKKPRLLLYSCLLLISVGASLASVMTSGSVQGWLLAGSIGLVIVGWMQGAWLAYSCMEAEARERNNLLHDFAAWFIVASSSLLISGAAVGRFVCPRTVAPTSGVMLGSVLGALWPCLMFTVFYFSSQGGKALHEAWKVAFIPMLQQLRNVTRGR